LFEERIGRGRYRVKILSKGPKEVEKVGVVVVVVVVV